MALEVVTDGKGGGGEWKEWLGIYAQQENTERYVRFVCRAFFLSFFFLY